MSIPKHYLNPGQAGSWQDVYRRDIFEENIPQPNTEPHSPMILTGLHKTNSHQPGPRFSLYDQETPAQRLNASGQKMPNPFQSNNSGYQLRTSEFEAGTSHSASGQKRMMLGGFDSRYQGQENGNNQTLSQSYSKKFDFTGTTRDSSAFSVNGGFTSQQAAQKYAILSQKYKRLSKFDGLHMIVLITIEQRCKRRIADEGPGQKAQSCPEEAEGTQPGDRRVVS